MLSNPLRRAGTLVGVLSLLAVAGPVASAAAIEPTSRITSPTSPTYALYNEGESSPPAAFTVKGTTTISGEVALRCYFPGAKTESYDTLAENVEVKGGEFSAEIQPKVLYRGACVLRAVPVTNKENLPPGTTAAEEAASFKGPLLFSSRFGLHSEEGLTTGYYLESHALAGYFLVEPLGTCGLADSYLYAPETETLSEELFFCDAALFDRNYPTSGGPTRSELQIDGANAYSPAAAREVAEEVKAPISGTPQTTVTESFNAATGAATIKELDPIVKCSPETVYPPTAKSCTSFAATGVELERTWETGEGNHIAWVTDTWRSTDGAAHSLSALYAQELAGEVKAGGAFKFPGASTYSTTSTGQSVSIPAGPGAIYYTQDAATPATGDGVHPQGAILYDTPPAGPAGFNVGSGHSELSLFEMPYQAAIPAGGSYTLHMAFVQAYALAEVEALAKKASERFPASPGPSLSIAAPANGTTVSAPNVAVSGTLTDPRPITSFTVDGQPVSVGSGGAWSTSVPLLAGANTVRALATDQAGLSAEKTVSVTYAPVPPVAHASQVGSASGANGEVRFTILCTGPAGTSCELESTVSTVEKTRHGRLVAVSARRHAHGSRSTTVTVGSSKVTIPAGQRVTVAIALNATGVSLLTRFGALPVHLAVVLVSSGHRSTVIAQNLTVIPHHRKHRHHRRHHRR